MKPSLFLHIMGCFCYFLPRCGQKLSILSPSFTYKSCTMFICSMYTGKAVKWKCRNANNKAQVWMVVLVKAGVSPCDCNPILMPSSGSIPHSMLCMYRYCSGQSASNLYIWKSSILSIYSEICIHIMACKGEPYMYISCIISHGIR